MVGPGGQWGALSKDHRMGTCFKDGYHPGRFHGMTRHADTGRHWDRRIASRRALRSRIISYAQSRRKVPLRVHSSLAEEVLVHNPGSGHLSSSACMSMEALVEPVVADLELCRQNLLRMLGHRHPMLMAAASQIFSGGGKQLRPLIVLLMAKATLMHNRQLDEKHRRLAEIAEMIHTASLVHDDVLDSSSLRRGKPTINSLFGIGVAVLAGDFLFAQSVALLARLENLEVIKRVGQVVGDFADGEISQAELLFKTDLSLEDYLDKSFYKTASLVAESCRCAAILSGCSPEITDAMYAYGRNLGLAFQVVDDVLDYTQSEQILGKPPGQDLRSGNITAPAHFALQDPVIAAELKSLIESRFVEDGAHQRALDLILASDGIPRSFKVVDEQVGAALLALECLPPSPAKLSLQGLLEYIPQRIS